METQTSTILVLAVVVEATTEYIFGGIPAVATHMKKMSLLVGVLVALAFQADLFPLLGITAVSPVVSQIFTGVLISRGSNILNDLLQIVKKVKA